jgi:hypothetical protein
MNRQIRLLGLGILTLLASAVFALAADPMETFTGFGVHMGTGKAGTVIVGIDHWSTDEERDKFLGILKDKGQKGLIEALHNSPRVGYIRLANSRGYDLHFARSTELPDGTRRVVIATDRTLHFREVSGHRSRYYDFSIAEMHFPKGEKGEGKLAPATSISFNKETNTLELENYGNQPVRLSSITSKKP